MRLTVKDLELIEGIVEKGICNGFRLHVAECDISKSSIKHPEHDQHHYWIENKMKIWTTIFTGLVMAIISVVVAIITK